jgi:vitamin B12 transporter
VLVLLDGVQLNEPGGAFDFSTLTLDNVERIEIVRGPSSALYGSDAAAGVVHVVSRVGRGAPVVRAQARGGSLGRMDWGISAEGGADGAAYSLALSRARTEGALAFNNRHTNNVLSGAVHLAPDDATSVRLAVRLSDSEYHFPTDGDGQVVDRNSFTFGDRTTVSASATHRIGSRFDIQGTIGLSESDGGTDDQQDGPDDDRGFYAFTSLDHVRRASADFRANLRLRGGVGTIGWEVEEERQRSFNESLSEFGATSGRSDYERWNRAYYGHVTGAWGRLSYNTGVRLEDNQRFGTLWTWQVGAAAGVGRDRGTVLRSSLGKGIKEPTFYETFATGFAIGNPELDPERTVAWELGLDHVFGRVTVRGTWFQKGSRDLIQYTSVSPIPGGPNFFNVAESRSRGVELSASAEAGPLGGSASWTVLDTEVEDPGLDAGPGAEFVAGERLLRRPRHTASANGSLALGSVVLVGSVDVVGRRDDRDFSTFPATRVVMPRYAIVGLGLAWTARSGAERGPEVELSLRGDNLLDDRYEEVIGFPALGRVLEAGARISFGSLRR